MSLPTVSRPQLRRTILTLSLLSVGACSKSGPSPASRPNSASLERGELLADLKLSPLSVDKENPKRRRFGPLTLLAAYELDSAHEHFGGLSGLALSSDGKRLVFITDRGRWFSAVHGLDAESGALKSLGSWHTGRLLAPSGKPVTTRLRDAESITVHGGHIDVSYEQIHRVWRHSDLRKAPKPLWMPPKLAKAPSNGGLEAVTALADGRLLVFCEKYKTTSGALRGWLVDPAKKDAKPLSLVVGEGFKPTDLATLPSSDVLLLERAHSFFGGTRIRLRRIAKASLVPNARLAPKELLRLDRRHAVDNFEGLAVQRHTRGTLVYLVSDDNFSRLQRTLLYQFRL